MNSEVLLRKNLDGLTGLRFFAAIVVLLAHALDVAYAGTKYRFPYSVDLAYFGMTLFFCLSGFVIYYNYSEALIKNPVIGAYNFAVARFARLYPLYFVVLILLTGPKLTTFFQPYSYGLWSYLTLTQSWIGAQGATFGPAWSISTECAFYLFFALIGLRVVHRLSSCHALAHLSIFLVIIFGVYWLLVTNAAAAAQFIPPLLPDQYKNTAWQWILYPAPYTRSLEFIAGMLTAKLYLSPQMSHIERFLPWASVLSVAMVILGIYLFPTFVDKLGTNTLTYVLYHMRANAVFVPFIAIILLGVSSQQPHPVKSICINQQVLRLGEMSYSIYLMQHFGFSFLNNLPTSVEYWADNDILKIVFSVMMSVAATLIISFGTYNLIEIPSRCAIRRAFSYENISDTVAQITFLFRRKAASIN